MVRALKVLVVGDAKVGKTCLLQAYADHSIPEKYLSTISSNYTANVVLEANGDDGKMIEHSFSLQLWDTSGDYELSGRIVDVHGQQPPGAVLIAYDVNDRKSYENAARHWCPLVAKEFPHSQLLLVGTKTDKRVGKPHEPWKDLKNFEKKRGYVSSWEGNAFAKELRLDKCHECSVSEKGSNGLSDLFNAVMKSVVEKDPAKTASGKQGGEALDRVNTMVRIKAQAHQYAVAVGGAAAAAVRGASAVEEELQDGWVAGAASRDSRVSGGRGK